MKQIILAQRYAKALFSIARDEGRIEEYGAELDAFLGLVAGTPALADALGNPLYPLAAREAVFSAVAEKAGFSQVMKGFLVLVLRKGRMGHLREIAECYGALSDAHRNIARAVVSAPVPLPEATLSDIASGLSSLTGKKVAVQFRVAPELIGGVVAQIGDMVIDGSVRTQLQKIKETLKKGGLG